MHIAGSIFIFNIFMGQRPVSYIEKHIREPPQWGALRKSTIDNRKSSIANQPQAGIFHPFGADSLQPTAHSWWSTTFSGHLSAYCPLPTAFCLLPTAFRPFRPPDPDAGILPCGLRRLDGLGFEKVGDLRADVTAPHSNTSLIYQPILLK
jgi:hypothetical protein